MAEAMTTIRLDDMGVLSRLTKIAAQVEDMTPAMAAIGELLVDSTKERFATSTGPDGKRWAPNAPSTVLARLAQISGAYTKSGKLSKKGVSVVMAKKPLVDSGLLADSWRYQVSNSGRTLEMGTDRFAGEWDGGAAVFQFGDRRGRIPPREIVGVSPADLTGIIEILDQFITQSVAD